MIHSLHMIEITQSIGTFYVGKIDSDELIKITKTIRRNGEDGIQRELSEKRAKEIAKYCEDPDAAFPTPIILSVNDKESVTVTACDFAKDIIEFTYDNSKKIAEILDGQHRVEGIKRASNYKFEMMIVVMFDLTEEEKAYVFSTINSNQTKVDKSLIYDLFELSQERSPQKTCHEIARIMNSDTHSPFYQRLKMLGKKGNELSVLSQGTFVNYLARLITNKPQQDMIDLKQGKAIESNKKYLLRQYFIEERDDVILKLLYNYFGAVAEVFEKEWNAPDKYILAKTTGYGALLKAFEKFYYKGAKQKNLSKDYFVSEFEKVKCYLQEENIQLTSNDIPSGEQGQRTLAELIVSCL